MQILCRRTKLPIFSHWVDYSPPFPFLLRVFCLLPNQIIAINSYAWNIWGVCRSQEWQKQPRQIWSFLSSEKMFFVHLAPPSSILIENSTCFTARAVEDVMTRWGTLLKTVISYAPKSNGRAERMVGTIKRNLKKMVTWGGRDWEEALPRVLFGYHLRPLGTGTSPFELLYGSKPRIKPSEVYNKVERAEERRDCEIMALSSMIAKRFDFQIAAPFPRLYK